MNFRAAVAVLAMGIVAASAGCLGASQDPAAGADEGSDPPSGGETGAEGARENPCLGAGGGAVSGNAPVLPAFSGEPAQVAARFAAAVGDPLTSAAPDERRSDDTLIQWNTQSGGSIGYRSGTGDPVALHWVHGGRSPMDEAEARAFLNGTLQALGIPAGETGPILNTNPGSVNLHFRQSFRDAPVEGTGGSFATGVTPILTLEPYRDFSAVTVQVGPEDAEALARARMRCELDEAGKTREAGYTLEDVDGPLWAVAHDSLLHGFTLEYATPGDPGHCGLVYAVEVDVETGAVMWGRPPCD